MEERLARLEGRTEELSKRLDGLRGDVNHRFDHIQWKVRIWFLVLIALVTIINIP